MPDNRCSSCVTQKTECTYQQEKQKPGPRPGTNRLIIPQSCRLLIAEILKGTPSESYLSRCLNDDASATSIVVKLAARIKELESENEFLREKPLHVQKISNPEDSNSQASSELVEKVTKELAEFTLPSAKEPVHFGESSTMMLVMTAVEHRKQVDSNLPDWEKLLEGTKRPQYWDVPPWLAPPRLDPLRYEFPDPYEIKRLVDAYFDCHNLFSPLLHRPSFERSLADKLHIRDEAFGAVVLAVCAIGSRYRYGQINSSDPNVMFVVSGIKWFHQLPIQRFAFAPDVSLYHLQMYCLAMIYIQNINSGPEVLGGWMITGIAIRLAQEKGFHRRFVVEKKPTPERELWKRVFWFLLFYDFNMGLTFGRPRAMSIEDFDIDFAIECDDEYWEHLTHPFVQPPNKPPLISFWNHFMKMYEISILAAQPLYSVRKIANKDALQKVVSEIDSALAKWADSIPTHLMWNIKHEDENFFKQSAILWACYYWIQIEVHRRFIPRPGEEPELSFPSMTICANAARSCIHVVETCLQQTKDVTGHFMLPVILPLFASAMILVINLWRGKQVDPDFDPRPDLTVIYKCIGLLRMYESSDITNAVMSATRPFFSSSQENFAFGIEDSAMFSTFDPLDLQNRLRHKQIALEKAQAFSLICEI
ncbi:hypothetical protein D9758_015622 [Tetrapyrgos nigripes]|uniref:Xylanolytic transcriptional activator regulatory domain-containing protein n=1 Tax=Tetrapyrgos nigripes TaxID=182062 RepID=A0A8H5CKC7_9AGAR|nr:hypothetical protein D9758_015622 [Tetrapyrgos nigripes]